VTSRLQWWSLGLVVAGTLVVPLGLRPLNALLPGTGAARPSYIPSVETPRDRKPFDDDAAARLRDSQNDYFVIGDSMAGTRIDPGHLSRLVGGHGAASLLHPGSGPAYWYLTFKNLVVGTGQRRAKAAIFFFRDAQMTDTLMRLYPGSLDRVAHDTKPELDRILAANTLGPFYRLHTAAQIAYRHDRTREWLTPRLADLPVPLVVGPEGRPYLLAEFNKQIFTLENLRKMAAADIQEIPDDLLDFRARLPLSVLPEIVRLSKASGIRVAFVRVQRRPTASGPPPQSEKLARYVRDFEGWLRENGAYFRDERGDPDQPLSVYEDGDHIARAFRRRYTELFVEKNPGLFR
jgi:hypothetical protein